MLSCRACDCLPADRPSLEREELSLQLTAAKRPTTKTIAPNIMMLFLFTLSLTQFGRSLA